jgi:Na+/glutamate symporter
MKGDRFERMDTNAMNRSRRIALSLGTIALTCSLSGCRRSPTFNILGSFFPSWLICMFAGILLAVAFNRILANFNLDREIDWSIVVYPCLALFFACTLWLILFS